MPIHCSDVTDVIFHIVTNNINSKIIECIGPEEISFKVILQKLLKAIDKKRLLLPMPFFVAKMTAKILQLLPKPLLTEDQLTLLKYDNIPSKKYKTNFDLGVPSKRFFSQEVEKYSFMWKDGGQYSTEKYNKKN
mgnify:FL=1